MRVGFVRATRSKETTEGANFPKFYKTSWLVFSSMIENFSVALAHTGGQRT